jgi:mono/diheme cytochrome c family protein
MSRQRFILAAITAIMAQPLLAAHEFAGRDVAQGQVLYAENCASCHGINLEGQPNWRTPDENGILPAPPHDETGHTWHHDSVFLFQYVKFGGQAVMDAMNVENFTSGMPEFGGTLSDDQIIDILAYIQSTWPEQAQQAQASRTQGH